MKGLWIRAPKTPESREKQGKSLTLIHDDKVAQKLGYQGGFVGGSTLMAVTHFAVFSSFGHNWYEKGVYSVRLANPVFAEDEIRVVWEDVEPDPCDKRKITFYLEKRDGTQTTFGWAALGKSRKKLTPPWERDSALSFEPADDLMPEIQVGDRYPDFECRIPKEQFIPKLDKIGDYNWWYRVASPWGAPIVPPSEIGIMVLYGVKQRKESTSRIKLRTSMWAGFDIVINSPVFVDRNYRFRSRLCEKGITGRSIFFTDELTMDDNNCKRVAIIHNKSRHLISGLE